MGAAERIVAAALVLAGAVPLLAAWPVPLQDWPNHVAGAHVLAALLQGDPFWARFYRFNTFLVPDAAVDLGLLGFRAAGVPEATAARLVLLLTYAVFVAGMGLLSRATATLDATRVAGAVLLFYSAALFWGLVSYVLGVGLMWGLIALWIGVERFSRWRLVLAAAGAAALLFTHAVPAVVFALLLACFDAARWRAGAAARSCGSGPLALAVVVILLRLLPGRTGHDLSPLYAGSDSAAAFALWKLRIFAAIPLGGSFLQDAASLVAFAGGGLALVLGARRRLTGAAIGVGALVVLTLAAPERLGTGSLLDVRLAALPVMLAVASVRLDWRGVTAQRLALAVVALAGTRTLVIAAEWRQAARVFAAFDAQAARLPAGSLMMMAYGQRLETLAWTQIWSPPIQSIAAGVVNDGIFFPALFANPDQQPIALRPAFQALAQPWNFSDADHRRDSLAALAPLCASGQYSGVFLTVLYGKPPFQILDACTGANPGLTN